MSTKLPVLMACRNMPRPVTVMLDGEFWSPTIEDGIDHAVRFDIQVAHDIFMQKWKTKSHDKTHIAKLPYPLMWVEWRDEVRNFNVACILYSPELDYRDTDQHPDLGIGATFLTLRDEETYPRLYPIEVNTIDTDDDGTVRRIEFGNLGNCELDDRDNLEKVCHYYLFTVLTALGLINCKNVHTAETGRINVKRSGAEKRRGELAKTIRYRTIILPGNGTESDGKGGHRATALHRVRGHFKTFTAERPLLGQHVGTYWWGWQVRGKAENGIVISDYKVGA
ncbi:MAG: hypothetical protein K0U84_01790 [Actinomycetia bacterium]|nr:hypothetical protein [Actinomycetes bacterium]